MVVRSYFGPRSTKRGGQVVALRHPAFDSCLLTCLTHASACCCSVKANKIRSEGNNAGNSITYDLC